MRKTPPDKSSNKVIPKSVFLGALKNQPVRKPRAHVTAQEMRDIQLEANTKNFGDSIPAVEKMALVDLAAVRKVNLHKILKQWVKAHPDQDAVWPKDTEEGTILMRALSGMIEDSARKGQKPTTPDKSPDGPRR